VTNRHGFVTIGRMASWRKSSFSFSNGNCLEVAGDWRKSSHSMGNECAEVASLPARTVAVRDSQLAESPVLTFGGDVWAAFTSSLKEAP
jgi:hypothetical protein